LEEALNLSSDRILNDDDWVLAFSIFFPHYTFTNVTPTKGTWSQFYNTIITYYFILHVFAKAIIRESLM